MSWIITERATGKAVMETFSETTAQAVNLERFDVQEAGQYLAALNQGFREELTPHGIQLSFVPPPEPKPTKAGATQLRLF